MEVEVKRQRESAKTIRIDLQARARAEKKEPAPSVSWNEPGQQPESGPFALATGRRSHDFTMLFESIYDAVLITEPDGRVEDCNERAQEFFRCDRDELIGRFLLDLIPGAEPSLLASIQKNLEDHRYTLIEGSCRRKDRSVFPAEIAVNRIDLNEGPRLCVFVRDITVRRRAQEALEEAVVRLEAHDRARLQFVSNVSHELKTPLTSMIYAVNNMLNGVVGPVSDRVRRYLDILSGDCKRLLSTVNDILDLRKIETKTLTLARTKVPFARLVRQSVDSLRGQAKQKSLHLRMSADTYAWFVDCDPAKMERVILNVVGNAIKFTPDGGTIDVRVSDDPLRTGFLLLTVRDSGIGIPPEALDKVTIQYFTVGEQPTGSGLGLAISKEIVVLHNGQIDIRSPPPGHRKGTVVEIRLPVSPPPKVLLVDDDEAVLSLLEERFRRQGYRTTTAVDGREAEQKIRQDAPGLIVLDILLPGIDGTELILNLRSDKKLMRIPIIVLTAAQFGPAKTEILNSFSIPVIRKPWDEEELFSCVAEAFMGSATMSRRIPASRSLGVGGSTGEGT